MAHVNFRRFSIYAATMGTACFIATTCYSNSSDAATPDPSPLVIAPPSPAFSAISRARLNVFLDALEKGDTQNVSQLLPAFDDPLLQKAVEWMWLISPNSKRSFAEITGFIDANPNWPSQALLRQRAEEAMTDAVPDFEILAWFKRSAPVTADGATRQISALLSVGEKDAAVALIRNSWINENFGTGQAKRFIDRYGKYIDETTHEARLDRLLWEGRTHPANRMMKHVSADYQKLAEARLALRERKGNVDAAIRNVPAKYQKNPGLMYERVRWRRINDQDKDARDLLLHQANDLAYISIRPEYWWTEKAILARRALQEGYITDAYRLVANHGQTEPADIAGAEWLAGWIALEFLGDSQIALQHFQNLYDVVQYPISQSRGAYWAGRACKAMGDKVRAKKWFLLAADHAHTFYGQLANDELGGTVHYQVEQAHPTPEQRKKFENNELTKVSRELGDMGLGNIIRPFIMALVDQSDSPEMLAMATGLAAEYGRTDLAVIAAKRGIRSGGGYLDAAYPVYDLVPSGQNPDPGLVHAIMRQESLFNPAAVSYAGARGLMQLMPATAERMAHHLDLPFSVERLTEDPGFNIQLGRQYLSKLLNRWNGAEILTIASYNAGPSRVKEWISEYGDPREPDVDPIDWIEMIPYKETRNYVQRVMEGTYVYRRRFARDEIAMSQENPDTAKPAQVKIKK
ncbi:lytic transglycosylase domain-containing protein [Thalassospira sp. MCCC 1A01428]|uniref:lytic transglycosylase domain-containing protein n=1 Tax=Thalassospira sp. MCCC 1A01428 TaxID=1470575 RepID=UPI000A1EA147|nr:lytic transglycosylase domain-containing protein [Thalassospira sp. MCCC 1A01428]OSQ41541.1 lytic murein transglycosylase [Thalassospira sp. MCCC 1A01428]